MSELQKAKRGGIQKGGSVPEPLQQARRLEAVNQLMLGYSYRQIGERMGVSHTTVGKYIKHQLTEYRESSRQSIDNWRGFITQRYEAKLLELHERSDQVNAIADEALENCESAKERLDKVAIRTQQLASITNQQLQIHKAMREMHGLDIRPDSEVSQHQVTHFVLRPGGALDLKKEE